jgi:undecaprenyl-diphosphatase
VSADVAPVRERSPQRRVPRGALRDGVTLVAAGVAIWAVLAGIGLLLTRTAIGNPLTDADARVSRWIAQQRTATWNSITHIGSSLSDTLVAIAITAVVMAFLLLIRRRREAIVVLVAIAGELFVFLMITAAVHRARPPVPHLDPAPPTSSFPSGHTGAAVALYGAMAVLLLRHTSERRALYRGIAVLLWCVPVLVGVCRIYRGMHFPSDVVAGALGGGAWLVITLLVLDRPRRNELDRAGAAPSPPP